VTTVFALAGAAALTSSITQVISCSVVLFEMTGYLALLIEILVWLRSVANIIDTRFARR
jgi:H+/Cl- antiporter ClcA